MKHIFQTAAAMFLGTCLVMSSACTLFIHEHDAAPAPTHVESSTEKTSHVENHDNGVNSESTQVETHSQTVRETVK